MKISTKQYAEVLYELTLGKSETEVNIVVEKFVKELIKNNNIKLAPRIINKFEEIYNKNNGIIEASVTSATKLDKAHLEKIEKYLIDRYEARKIILINEVDAEIKGGIILRVEDEMLDGSVSGRLKHLKNRLVK